MQNRLKALRKSRGYTQISLQMQTGIEQALLSKFENGERKVMEISEILGTDKDGEPIVHTLFKYNFTGRMATDANGRVKVLGEFKQEGVMSEKLKNSLFKVGIPIEQIAEFCEMSGNSETKAV